ncbi:MAG: glutamine amidotransferase family protein [Pseudomonadota bacterium]
MCGIVGLFLRDTSLEPEFGAMMSTMLETMTDRGPDSAGFAVYGQGSDGVTKATIRGQKGVNFEAMVARLSKEIGETIELTERSTHAVLNVSTKSSDELRKAIREDEAQVELVSMGEHMEVYKEVGLPADVASQFELESMSGTHGIGHTRMATESAVTTAGAHPFTTGLDQCLVHNGSLSNHHDLRRRLANEGVVLETENDSEAAAGYISSRLRQGDALDAALESSLDALDGFFTFVVGTASGFGVLRDPIACKPAVMVETDQYVAFGSEYRALVDLPGVERGRVWEPEPATVYFWER